VRVLVMNINNEGFGENIRQFGTITMTTTSDTISTQGTTSVSAHDDAWHGVETNE
jgi:hypothetical protein